MVSINPATGEEIKRYPETGDEELKARIGEARDCFMTWRRTGFEERASLMRKAAGILRKNAPDYSRLMALEMGKPAAQGRAEAEKCALVCDYYAENAASFLKAEPVDTGSGRSCVSFQPLGVILAVMPWNFPFWQVFRFAAPSLMAGNTCLLKHASNVPGCALEIERVFAAAGFPGGAFSTLLIGPSQAARLIENPAVRAVTLTGSTEAGREVASVAGRNIKKSVLELGGSDPYLILEDADLEKAADICATSRLINSGQSCIAAKRFIVVDKVKKRFEELLKEKMAAGKMGDPLDGSTDIGPLARLDLRDQLHRQVQDSIAAGAVCLLGGRIPGGPGAFYPPTILSEVEKGMPAYQEELFGPVAAVIAVKDEKSAVTAANDSQFGLGAAVFTGNTERGERIAREQIDSGNCFVNSFVRSDPRLPFGGVKLSGYGRELSSFGIREFVNVKTIHIEADGES